MTTKITIAFIFLFVVASCSDNSDISSDKPISNNVFASLNYDKVVAYNYDGDNSIEIIDDNGRLAPSIKKKVTLNRPQIIKLTNIICSKSTYGGSMAACFDPHFGIVFYKSNKPKAYISVCLDCNSLASSIDIPGLKMKGFSNKGAKNIYEFEKQIKLFP